MSLLLLRDLDFLELEFRSDIFNDLFLYLDPLLSSSLLFLEQLMVESLKCPPSSFMICAVTKYILTYDI